MSSVRARVRVIWGLNVESDGQIFSSNDSLIISEIIMVSSSSPSFYALFVWVTLLSFLQTQFVVAWIPKSSSASQPKSISKQTTKQYRNILTTFTKYAVATTAPYLLSKPAAVLAQQGSIKPSTPQEVKAAIRQLKECVDVSKTMKEDAAKGAYQAIGDKLSTPAFTGIDNAFTTLVRSDNLTQDEKTTLGKNKSIFACFLTRYNRLTEYTFM